MGYPVNQIGVNTRLFSIIGANAIEKKQDTFFNNAFQLLDVDCKMMPLNIREDDLGFFLHGLKDSKIEGAFLDSEYWKPVYDLLHEGNDEVQHCGICDTITIADSGYNVELVQGRATLDCVNELCDVSGKNILIVGDTPSSKSFLWHLVKTNPAKILLAAHEIEMLRDFVSLIPEHIKCDVIRIQNNKIEEKSDISIDFTNANIISESQYHLDFTQDFNKILEKIAKIKTKEWSV